MKPLSLLLVILLVAGCSTTRKVQKREIKASNEVTVQTDTKERTTDKTVTTVTEQRDTVIFIPGVKIVSEASGVETWTTHQGDTLTAVYDPVRNVITAKVVTGKKPVTVKVNKVTEIRADIVKEVEVKKDSTAKAETVVNEKNVDVKREAVTITIVAGVVLLLIAFAFLKYKKLL